MTHVAIVGGGLIGLASAYELASRGRRVTVIEAADAVGTQTSRAPGGIMTPSMSDPWNSPGVGAHLFDSLVNPRSAMRIRPLALPGLIAWGLRFLRNSLPERHEFATVENFRLCHASTELLREWQAANGWSFDYAQVGSIKLFRSAEAMAGPLRLARMLEPLGLRFDVLDADATIAKEPLLEPIRPHIAGALFFPNDTSGDAYMLSQEMRRSCAALGVEFRLGETVRSILRDNGRAAGVVCESGTIAADCVIVASGNGSNALLAPFGIKLPIAPAKGYSLTLTPDGNGPTPGIPVVDDAMHSAVIPLGRSVRIAGTAEFAGVNHKIEKVRIDNLLSLLGATYPELAPDLEGAERFEWTGLRPMSADGRPFVGPTAVPGLYANSGHGHLGLTMAAGSAQMLADLMDGKTPALDPAPFDPRRV